MTGKQLQFESALNNGRIEFQIPPNRSVGPEDMLRLSRQAKAIYERLQAGPATTSELAAIGLQYGARINSLRHYLVKQGKCVDVIEGENGNNLYEIVPLERSTFWRRVREKQEVYRWL